MSKQMMTSSRAASLLVALLGANGCAATSSQTPGILLSNEGGEGHADTASGESGGGAVLGFAPSNVNLSDLDLSEIGDVTVSGTGCKIDEGRALLGEADGGTVPFCGINYVEQGVDSKKYAYKIVTQPDATRIGVYVVKSLRIEASSQVFAAGTIPIVIVALDTITLLGSLQAFSGTAGAYNGERNPNSMGAGPGGGSGGTATGNLVAGSGASYCGVGGAGAAENAGIPNTKSAPYGSAQIVPLVGGSAGGIGAFSNHGEGGGAIQLVAGTSITVAVGSYISVGGGGGMFGGGALNSATNNMEATGGGSGGSILLEAPAVTVAGTLAANGGGGGEGIMLLSPSEDGQPSNVAALGGRFPGGLSMGGNGSAANESNGSDGSDTAGYPAGGGGGGAGRIRINTRLLQATITGTLSPTNATGCATVGVFP